jgi:hypothetical protein
MAQAKPGELWLDIDGVFDVAAALRVREMLAHLAPGTVVGLDVSTASECHDAAVAVLADAARRRRSIVVGVRGLSPHQIRMLRYLGVEPGGHLRGRTPDIVAKA